MLFTKQKEEKQTAQHLQDTAFSRTQRYGMVVLWATRTQYSLPLMTHRQDKTQRIDTTVSPLLDLITEKKIIKNILATSTVYTIHSCSVII